MGLSWEGGSEEGGPDAAESHEDERLRILAGIWSYYVRRAEKGDENARRIVRVVEEMLADRWRK